MLVPVRADEHVHTCRGPGGDALPRRPGQDLAVHHGLEHHEVRDDLPPAGGIGRGLQLAGEHLLRADHLLDRDAAQCRGGGGHAQLGGQVVRDAPGGGRGQCVVGRAALEDRAPEQARGARHREQRTDAHRAGGLAGDGHLVRVSAERGHVVAHPLQRSNLVEQAEIGRCVGQQREPLDAEPVVQRDRDDPVPGEGGAVRQGNGARAVDEGTPMDPHQYRQAPRVRDRASTHSGSGTRRRG